MMKWRLLILTLLLSIIVVACAPPPNLRDDSFLNDTSLITGEPCQAPCWRNITPGETSWRDAIIILEDDPQLVDVQVENAPEGPARIANFNAVGSNNQCCRLYSDNGQVVTAILTLLAPQMRLGAVIDTYGEPTYLIGNDVSPDQTLLSLIFPDVPLVTYVFGEGSAEGDITPNNEIIGAIYLSDIEMENLIMTTYLYEWTGYAPINRYLDGDFDVTPADFDDLFDDETDD